MKRFGTIRRPEEAGITVQEVLDALYGAHDSADLYAASHRYVLRDFADLLQYRNNGYDPDRIANIIRQEQRRLCNRRRIARAVRSIDGLLTTNLEQYRGYSTMYREAVTYYRYSSLRDKGIVRRENEVRQFKKDLKGKYLQNRDLVAGADPDRIIQPDALVKLFGKLTGIGSEEAALLQSEVCRFVAVCPEQYIRRGLFAKYLGSFFGAMKFNHQAPEIEYLQKFRIGSSFGKTYLFDEIIDDPAYSAAEKEAYYRNILQILSSRRGDRPQFSQDALMAYTEDALITLRETLSEERWNMAAKAYAVLAEVSVMGAGWAGDRSLSDENLYVHAALKGAYTRIIPAVLADCKITGRFVAHCLRSGYLFQLPDDLRDIPDDLRTGIVTAFTYYPNGVGRLQHHPIDILLTALSRTAYVDYPEMKDACRLYMTCIFQSLKALQMSNQGGDLCIFFRDMQFPDERIPNELCRGGREYCMVTDFETEIARECTTLALEMKNRQPPCTNDAG